MASRAERDLILNLHEKREGNAMVAAARDLDKLAHGADVAGDKFDGMARDAKQLETQIEHTRARIADLGSQFSRTGDQSLFGDLKKERGFLAELQRIRKELDDAVPVDDPLLGGRRGLQVPKLDFSRLVAEARGQLITGLVAVVALASPAIGAMVAGAVAGTVAGGGIIGGVVAAAHDARVKQAWGDFTAQLTSDAFGAGAMAGPTIKAIETLKSTFHDLDIGATFAKGAPALQELTDGISMFVTNLMPGFNAVMDDSEAIMSVFGDGLADTGDALSDMLVDIVSSKGTLEGLHYLFMFLNGTIRALGNTLEFLGNLFHRTVRFSASFTGALEDILHWAELASPLFQPIAQVFAWMNDNMEDIAGTAPMMASGMTGTVDPITAAGGAAAQSAEEFQAQADALKAMNEQLYAAQGFLFDADKAVDKINKDMLTLTQSVYENGVSLDDHTEKGLNNREMIRGMIDDLRMQYEANVKAGMSTADASLLYSEQANILQQRLTKELGFANDAVGALIGSMKQIPPQKDIALILHYETQGTPIGEHSGQRFNETYRITPSGFQEFAAGGVVLGPPGSAQMVIAHAGERVLTQQQQASGWGGGAGYTAQPFVYGGSSEFEAHLIESIRRGVQARGGELAVLSLKAPR